MRRPLATALGVLAALWGEGAAFGQESGEGAVPRSGPGAAVKPAEQPKEEKAVITEPELIEFVNAAYPAEGKELGLEANVVLKLTIDKQGNVTEAEVLEPAGHGFDEAARDAALRFRFKPATRNGQPIAVKIPYRYSFTLTEVEKPAPVAAPTTGNLTGLIRLSETDAPVAGARVVIKLPDGSERSITTDAAGRFRIDGVPPGKFRVRVVLEGFDPIDSIEDVAVGEETDVTLRLAPVSEGVEVTVRGERPPREVTRRTVERREIERIPGTSGDALRSLQSLPGVGRAPGLAGLLIVRGSAPEGTLTFVDGADVPFIYHFGGLSSAVPTELLERIDFYPGNFSARYGRAGGGIVDVALRSPDTRCYEQGKLDEKRTGCFHAMVQADLVDARALVQGPLPIEGWSFAAAGRRSWIDTWLRPVLEEAGSSVTSAPVYYDYQLIAERKIGDSRTSFRFYGSDDRLELIITDPFAQDPAFGGNLRFGTAFMRLQAIHEAELNSKVSLATTLSVGKDTADFVIGNFFFNQVVYPISWRYELGFKLFEGAKLNVGTDFFVAPFDVSVRFPQPPRPGEPDPGPYATRPPVETSDEGTAFRPAGYAELELQPTDRLRLVPGVRFDYARDSGHSDFSPRLNGRYDLVKGAAPDAPERKRTTLKGGIGVFHQPPQFQETDVVFGTPGIESNRWIHYALGVEQELTRQVEASVEGFYKDLTQGVSRGPAANGSYGYNNLGDGYVVGLETMLKYKPDQRFFGWLAYTLSRSVVQDAPDAPEYLFQYDQPHNLTVLGSYRLGRGWEFGARFRLVSGPLVTPATGALYAADAGSYAQLQGRPFSERLPLFHQLDIRIDKRWQIKNARVSAYLDFQNVYNNAAAEGIVYNYDFSKSQYQTGVPILPNLGMRVEI